MKYLLMIFFVASNFSILCSQVLDDIVKREIMQDRKVLAYQPLREADIFWEKRVWRIIDVREKMNLSFINPQAPFFDLLVQAVAAKKITPYSAEDDKFTYALSDEEMDDVLFDRDTIERINFDTGDTEWVPVQNNIFYEDIKRYRLKEVWFFDENTSTMQVRILGIAPLIEVRDEHGNFRYEKPLFWVYYPELRQALARHKVFLEGNDSSLISWENLFEMRYFASSIYKASNIRDQRLQEQYSGVDLLLEADKIKQEIFNFEHDLWTY